jgi:IS1 family transposase
VLGFVIDDRTDGALLRLLEEELHPAWRDLPVCTDGWGAYQRLLAPEQHEVCAKGSGKTSVVEALNTTCWRQRQSGLVRRSCGVSWRVVDDLTQRFLLLADRHNRYCLKRWSALQTAGRQQTQSSP